jgi:hypothetical protein
MKRIGQSYHHKPKFLPNLVRYVAICKENELIELIEKEGYDTGYSTKDLQEATMEWLSDSVRKKRFQNNIRKLYALHPDKEVILELFGTKTKSESYTGTEPKETKKAFLANPLVRLGIFLIVLVLLIVFISKLSD